MDSRTWRGHRLSRVTLGTVQFGMPYGIANRDGQPSYQQTLRILQSAWESGVTCFDTAAAYGESETILGRAFDELKLSDDVFVVTKVPAIKDPAVAPSEIEKIVEQSRRRLQMTCLPLVMFHREEDAVYLGELESLRQRGWIERIGVSCGNLPDQARRLAAIGEGQASAEALQVPANVLDRRHLESGMLEMAVGHDVAVFVRSVFLQGLLLMPTEQIRDDLTEVLKPRRRLQALAGEAGLTLHELALRFMLSLPSVTSVVLGVDRLEQLQANLEVVQKGPLDAELTESLLQANWGVSERTITPHMWEAKE